MAENISLLRFNDPERTVAVDVPAIWRDSQPFDDAALWPTTMRIRGIFREAYLSADAGEAFIGKTSPMLLLPTALIPLATDEGTVTIHKEILDEGGIPTVVEVEYTTVVLKPNHKGITEIELREA